MAVEGHLLRIRRSLEEKLGVEEAAYVIEGRPAGGWGSLVTKEHLDLRLGALEERIEGLEERFDLRLGALEEGSGLRQRALEERFEGLEERTTLRLEAVEHRLVPSSPTCPRRSTGGSAPRPGS